MGKVKSDSFCKDTILIDKQTNIDTSLIKKIVVKRSSRRRKTVYAKLKNNIMEVLAPDKINDSQLDRVISELKHKLEDKVKEKTANRENSLLQRAESFNRRYFGGKLELKYIGYSFRQKSKFGVCYPQRGIILINGCLKNMPLWVENYVIIHEMAHLVYPNHSKDFWKMARRYPKTERAIGYLMAKGAEGI